MLKGLALLALCALAVGCNRAPTNLEECIYQNVANAHSETGARITYTACHRQFPADADPSALNLEEFQPAPTTP
jgi:hypothetical protein